jgi:hypothetical protein
VELINPEHRRAMLVSSSRNAVLRELTRFPHVSGILVLKADWTRGAAMSKIMIKCLSNGQAVPTGMVTDQSAWNKLANDWAGDAFICPTCNKMHEWIKNDAFIAVSVKAPAQR